MASKGVRAEQWEADQPTGPLEERPAQPVPARGQSRRLFLTGLAAGGLAAGIAAIAALRFLPSSKQSFITEPATVDPTSTQTVAELTVDTNQAGRLIVNGRSSLLQLAWKPTPTNDTRMLVVNVSSNGGSHLYLWDNVSNQFHQLHQLQATLGTQSLAWEPAGERLAVAQPGSIVLGRASSVSGFDTRADVPLLLPPSGDAFPCSLAWLPDGQGLLYTIGQEVFRWTMTQDPVGNLVYSWHTSDPDQLVAGTFVGLWPSPNGQYVASTSNMMTESADGTNNDSQILNPLHIWRVSQDQTLAKIPPLPNGFTRLQWSPDSHYLVYGNNIQGLTVYDVQAGRTVIADHFPYPGDAAGYSPLSAWLQHGRYVALPKYVGTDPLPIPMLQVFEATSGRVAFTLKDYHYPIAVSAALDNRLAVCYMPGGPQSVGYLLVWYDGITGQRLAQQAIPIEVNELQWMPDGTDLAVCATDFLSVLNVWVYGQ
jgi:WD40 repeat protein